MKTLTLIIFLAFLGVVVGAGITRVYHIAAEEIDWDFAPSNYDMILGVDLESSPDAMMFTEQGDNRIGKVYRKSVYREYTDATFRVRSPRPEWLGILGPIIRAEVGDTINIVFFNNATFPFSIHPHGVFYDKNDEGAPYSDGVLGKLGDSVPPGSNYTYKWEIRDRAGPGEADASSILWSYHSHVSESADIYSGLIGPLIVYREGVLSSDGRPIDVDREFVAFLMVQDENFSPYLQQNIDRFTGQPATVDPMDEDFQMSNMMHAINGLMYGNLNEFRMCEGETVRWYAFSFGGEVDLHTLHWHGQTLLMDGHRVDVLEMLPATMRTLDMVIDNPGYWMLHCHLNDHLVDGMGAFFNVSSITECQDVPPFPTPGSTSSAIRVSFYILNIQYSWIVASDRNRKLFEASFKKSVSQILRVRSNALTIASISKGGVVVDFSVQTGDLADTTQRVSSLLAQPNPQLDDFEAFLPLAAYEDPSSGVTLDSLKSVFQSPTEGSQVGAIVGGVIGGLAGVAILGGVIYFVIRKRRNSKSRENVKIMLRS